MQILYETYYIHNFAKNGYIFFKFEVHNAPDLE